MPAVYALYSWIKGKVEGVTVGELGKVGVCRVDQDVVLLGNNGAGDLKR